MTPSDQCSRNTGGRDLASSAHNGWKDISTTATAAVTAETTRLVGASRR